ncbi:MAG TPA: DUF1508 domain-containing protein [Polyangiaceae bacterium]|jgi:uncharacterized protein YegP (UPF0339 family)|nr:DUF1508 domain-containing protein [Polyangiaceae bacterium]
MQSRFATIALVGFLGLGSGVLAGCTDSGPTTGDEQDVTAKSGRFETFKGGDGQYYFHLIAGNYEKVLHSEGYTSKASATKGIASVKSNGASSKAYKILKASNGEYYFNLVAANGEVIGTSELYGTKSAAQKGVDAVKALIVKQLRTEAAETGGAAFEVFDGKDGDTHFHLRAANGEIVLMSEGYADDDGALDGIESLRTNGRDLEQFEVLPAANGQYFFHVTAANGEIIAESEIYVSKANAERGRDAVIDLVASEKIADPE